MHRWLLLFSLFAALLLGGCVTPPPPPSYLTIDQTTPAFRTALEREAQRLVAEGKSVSQADELARKLVLERFTQRAVNQRSRQLTPLVNALLATEQKRGCWTFVATTTTRAAGKPDSVAVERFDASQAEDQLWTLLSRDGIAPDEKAQASYRKTKLRAWKKSQSGTEEPESSETADEGMNGELDVVTDAAPHRTTYTVTIGAAKVFLVANMSGYRKSYTLDESGRLMKSTMTLLGSAGGLAGSLKIEQFETATDYAIVDPVLAPFVVRTWQRARGKVLGVDSDVQEEEVVYSDYRRVTCHDDRFQVVIGPPKLMEFVPAK